VGKKGTITFLITINLNTGSEPWKVTSGTRAYKRLHRKGTEVVDQRYMNPMRFVMKGADRVNATVGRSFQEPVADAPDVDDVGSNTRS
jgi:hypothetical protein